MRQAGTFITFIRGIAGISQKVVLLGVCMCPSLAWACSSADLHTTHNLEIFFAVRASLLFITSFSILFSLPLLILKRTRKTAVKLYRFYFSFLVCVIVWGQIIDFITRQPYHGVQDWLMGIPVGILGTIWLMYETVKNGKLIFYFCSVCVALAVFVFSALGVMIIFFSNLDDSLYGLFIALGLSGTYLLYAGIRGIKSWKQVQENKQ